MDTKVKYELLDKNKVGARIREYRKKLKLTQENVAEVLDISIAFYGQVERGDSAPSLSIFVGICNALKVNPLLLLQDSLSDDIEDDVNIGTITKYKKLSNEQKGIIDYLLNDFSNK